MLLKSKPEVVSSIDKIPRTGIITCTVICVMVAVYLLGFGISSSRSQAGTDLTEDGHTQKLGQLVSSIDLNHHRFLRSSSRFVNGGGIVTQEETLWRLQHYASRFAELQPHLDQIVAEISQARSQHEDEAAKAADIFLARNQRVASTIKQLLRDGEATLIYVETFLNWLQPGDFKALSEIVTILDLLGDDITALEMAAQQRQVLIDEQAVKNKAALAGKLATARVSMAVGLLMLFTLGFFYVWHRQVARNKLRKSNEELLRQIDESRQLTEELQYRATHDGLSGLCNRSGFTTQLQEILDSKTGSHGLCFIDLDMFKLVNDSSGHAAGDQLIVAVAELLTREAPEHAIVARFGGDEFLVLSTDCDAGVFEAAMTNCCDALRSMSFFYEGRRFSISGSFGAVHFDAATRDMHTLMSIVDIACYEAKSEGGGRIKFRSGAPNIIELRRDDHEWVNRIQLALEKDQFCLYYQPIARVKQSTGKPVHSWEVLLRMIGENGELIAPGRFLDIAERFALASRIDSWVINRTFDWLTDNGGVVDEVDCININLSGKSIGNQELLQLIQRRAELFNGDLSVVCFEITETAIVGSNAREFLLKLKALGFRIALDDFGSGFSSFGYLESLPVDYIKIDGIFVRDIDSNPTHQEFVKAINAVGKAMEKLTVAEFVENGESLDILRKLGVDFAQGYHVARPALLPGTEVPGLRVVEDERSFRNAA